MTCEQLTESIADYRSGALPPAQRVECDAHLVGCPDCVRYLKTYEETIRLARDSLAAPDAPPPEKVVRAVLAARHKRR